MKIVNLYRLLIIALLLVIGAVCLFMFLHRSSPVPYTRDATWAAYKSAFIRKGQVVRPIEHDTISEGQAYAMLRAAIMGDKETFDQCYAWTEKNLSRADMYGDHLLAWQYVNGHVDDWMPASDADIDYALSLIMADAQWHHRAPPQCVDYGRKALLVLSDILQFETMRTEGGRLYLAPWILRGTERHAPYPQNPSYYAPAHFRIFAQYSGHPEWKEIAETTYYLLSHVSTALGNQRGVGLIPDWCMVTDDDRFVPFPKKNNGFGWEAVRVPIRVLLDREWFNSSEADNFFSGPFPQFLMHELENKHTLYAEYAYDGKPVKTYTHPLFNAVYALMCESYNEQLWRTVCNEWTMTSHGPLYLNETAYYTNSLVWLIEEARTGNLAKGYKEGTVWRQKKK